MFSHYTCFYSFFISAPPSPSQPTSLNFFSSSSTSVTLLSSHNALLAHDPATGKKTKSSVGGFSLHSRRWNCGWAVRCKHGSQSREVDSVPATGHSSLFQTWSDPIKTGCQGATPSAAPSDALLNSDSHMLAPRLCLKSLFLIRFNEIKTT